MDDQEKVALPQKVAELPVQYRRDLRLENVTLDRSDLADLMSLLHSKTIDAQAIQIQFENPTLFESEEKLESEIRRVFRINYNIVDSKDNSLSGYDIPDLKSGEFPDDIVSVYISNSEAFKSAAGGRFPRNAVDIYIDFKRPSMALNFLNLPSNPTDNKSVANVYGFDEDWVISTYQKLTEFFDSRKSNRSIIHRSGIYDLFMYAVYIPILLWGAYRVESAYPNIFSNMSGVNLVAIYIYGLLIFFLLGRFVFQYFRWLFPIVEYSADRNIGPKIHRAFIGAIISGIGLAVLYDILRAIFI